MRESYENYKELRGLSLNHNEMIQIFMNDTDLTRNEMIRTIVSYKIMFIHEQYDIKVKRSDQLQSNTINHERKESNMNDNDLIETI